MPVLQSVGLRKGGAVPSGAVSSTGILSLDGNETVSGTTFQRGWEFTADVDMDVTALRVYAPKAYTATLRLWRVSDATLLAEETVSTSVDTWVEASLASSVALSNGSNYVVTVQGDSSGNQYVRGDFYLTFDSDITYVTGRFVSGTGFPTGTSSGNVIGFADIAFTK